MKDKPRLCRAYVAQVWCAGKVLRTYEGHPLFRYSPFDSAGIGIRLPTNPIEARVVKAVDVIIARLMSV